MLVNVIGAKCIGIDAVPVTVEVDVVSGIGIHLVGLADTAVKESLLRTITALQALEYHIPGRKIVINLAPADLHKSGSGYDLPIAVGIIAALLAICVLGAGVYALYLMQPGLMGIVTWEVVAITGVSVLLFGILITFLCAWLAVNKFLRMRAGELYKI